MVAPSSRSSVPSSAATRSSTRLFLYLLCLVCTCVLLVRLEGSHIGLFYTNHDNFHQNIAVQEDFKAISWLDKHYNVCIVGAGLSGAVIAERYASLLQQDVLVLEKRPHIGGNCYDYIDKETNIRVSMYGAHLFHTYSRRVWDYVHRFAHWTKYEHQVLGLVDGKHVPIPVNIDTVNALFNLSISSEEEMNKWLEQEQVHYDHSPKNSEEMALSRVGPRLYDLIFKPYTFKQVSVDE